MGSQGEATRNELVSHVNRIRRDWVLGACPSPSASFYSLVATVSCPILFTIFLSARTYLLLFAVLLCALAWDELCLLTSSGDQAYAVKDS